MSKSRDIADSAATINFIDGLTSDAQSQLDDKAALDGSPTFTGTVTATSFSGDGSALTGVDSLPSQTGNAGEFLTTDGTNPSWTPLSTSPTLEAVASGTLANGDKVIVNANGTVSAAAESIINYNPSTFTDQTILDSPTNVTCYATVYDPSNDKFLIVYEGTSNYLTSVVVNVSGSTITYGTPVVIDSNSYSGDNIVDASYDSAAQVIVITYARSGGRAKAGVISGLSISYGSEIQFTSTTLDHVSSCYDITNNATVVVYKTGNNDGRARCVTASGTTLTANSEYTFASSFFGNRLRIIYDENAQKSVILFTYNSSRLDAVVASVSSNTLSFGATASLSNGASWLNGTYDSVAQKTIFVYYLSNVPYAVVMSISGTSVSFGSPVSLSANGIHIDIVYDAFANKSVIFYSNSTVTQGYLVSATVSGTSLSLGTTTTTTAMLRPNGAYSSTSKNILLGYYDVATTKIAGAVSTTKVSATNLTTENYIGISDGAYSDTATATVQIIGSVDDAQSGLTAGQSYYVQNDGSLGATADNPSVFAGTAVSATKLIVKG